MAKRKAPVPRKINEHKQSSLSWTMGQTSQQQHGTEGQQSSECDSLPSMELCIPNLIEDCELTTHLGNDDEESLKPLPSKRKKSRKQSETLQDANLRYLVEASDFYLTVDSVPHGVKDSVNKVIGKLGVVKFKLKENCCLSVLPEISHCKIYIGKTSNYCLYFEWPHLKDACQNCELESLQTGTELHIKYFEMENWPENYNLFAALRMKNCFSLRVQEFDSISQILTVAVWIRKAGLTSPSMYGNENSLRKSIRIIMKHFFGICAIGKTQRIIQNINDN